MRLLLIAAAVVVLQGCAGNPYTKFYHPIHIAYGGSFEPTLGGAQIVQGSNLDEDRIRLLEDGYLPIGYSSFNGSRVNQNASLKQAKVVDAALVLVYSKYRNTVSGVTPVTVPSTQTSFTNMSGMVGSTPVFGTGQTTTYGTSTSYIPYSVERSDYFATYWKKTPPGPLGVFVREPKADEHRAIGTNSGVIVEAVRKNSPAYNVDIFRGDVILRIGDSEIRQLSDFGAAITRYQGQSVLVLIARDSKRLEKRIDLLRRMN